MVFVTIKLSLCESLAISCARQSLVSVCLSLNQLLGAMAAGLPAVPAGLPVVEATRFPNEPSVGDWLRFRHPPADGRRFTHCFYDAFPNGRNVRSRDSSVSLHANIQVLEVVYTWIGYTIIRAAWNRRGYYIAVRFLNNDGLMLWTNYSRDDHIWLLPSDASD